MEDAGSHDRSARLDGLRSSLVALFSPSLAELEPVPQSTVEQARRFTQLAADLMREGAYDHHALARGWDVTVEAARKRVQRYVQRDELFTVAYKDRTFVPAFLLDERLQPRPELRAVIAPMIRAGERGFALWAWAVAPSPWLDGAVPHETARRDPDRVARAAEHRASNAA